MYSTLIKPRTNTWAGSVGLGVGRIGSARTPCQNVFCIPARTPCQYRCFPDALPDFRLTAGGWGHSPHTPPAQGCSNSRTLNLTPYVDTVRGSEGGICLDKAKGLSGIAAWGAVPGLSPRTPEKFLLKINEKLQFSANFSKF